MGDSDWHRVHGSPERAVEGSTQSYVRNPDYWGTDELFPAEGFSLPYADELTIFDILELTTAIAALRSGQIDKMGGVTGNHEISFDQQKTLAAQEPDLQWQVTSSGGNGVMFRWDTEPWYPDIRVRQAMQKAINLEELAATHYGGIEDPKPRPMVWGGSELDGYSTPWSERPEAVREGYTYDPQRARELLAEAGYPDGFTVNLLTGPGDNLWSGSPDVALLVKVLLGSDRGRGDDRAIAGQRCVLCADHGRVAASARRTTRRRCTGPTTRAAPCRS